MKIDKNTLTTTIDEEGYTKKTAVALTESVSAKKHKPSASQLQLIKLAKKFALDGAILPIEQQMVMQDRCDKRFRVNTFRKQENIEKIIKKSISYCSNMDVELNTDEDWFSQYLNFAENISNKTMQDLWAKILSGELSRPGSFSLKALKVFKSLSIHDAKLLAKACSLSIRDVSRKNIRIISGAYQKPSLFNMFDKKRQQFLNLSSFGLNYADLLSLADSHLIYIQESESNSLAKNEQLNFTYNNLPLKLSCKKANSVLQFYKFTPIGAELANLISDRPDQDFLEMLKVKLSHHFIVETK